MSVSICSQWLLKKIQATCSRKSCKTLAFCPFKGVIAIVQWVRRVRQLRDSEMQTQLWWSVNVASMKRHNSKIRLSKLKPRRDKLRNDRQRRRKTKSKNDRRKRKKLPARLNLKEEKELRASLRLWHRSLLKEPLMLLRSSWGPKAQAKGLIADS